MEFGERKLASWLDAFYDFTETLPTPPIFRKWAGIVCLAGALERKVWVMAFPDPLYPNLYVSLVAPPGVGKTVIVAQVNDMWRTLKKHHRAKSSLTRASLIDSLNSATRSEVYINAKQNVVLNFNSLLVACNELGVLLPAYDNDFMSTLTDLYDCRPYGEKKRTSDLDFEMDKPQLNILAATSPSYLNGLLPEGAWDQGFISRMILVFSGENAKKELFLNRPISTSTQKALIDDLSVIGKLWGEMKFERPAIAAINQWHMNGGPPTPDHPKLLHYNTRRTAHLLKLCMIASASEGNSLIINLDHYNTALAWLLEMEQYIPDIFKSMASGGDGKVIQEAWYFAYMIWAKEKKPVAAMRLLRFIAEKAPAHSVERIAQVMVKSGILQEVQDRTGMTYIPQPITRIQ